MTGKVNQPRAVAGASRRYFLIRAPRSARVCPILRKNILKKITSELSNYSANYAISNQPSTEKIRYMNDTAPSVTRLITDK